MEELVDISQDRGPLLFCCCTVAAPLPTLTGLEYYSPKPLFSLVFFLFPFFPFPFPHPTPSPPPLCLCERQPLNHSPHPSLARPLAHYALIRSAGCGLRGARRRRVFGRPAVSLQKRKKKQLTKCQELLFPLPTLPLIPVYLPSLPALPCLSDDSSH